MRIATAQYVQYLLQACVCKCAGAEVVARRECVYGERELDKRGDQMLGRSRAVVSSSVVCGYPIA